MDSEVTTHTNESTESDVAPGGDDDDGGEGNDGADSGHLAIRALPVSSVPSDDASDPAVGMQFETAEDAWVFYNAYARRAGFNTRISVYQRSRRNGAITARQFVCAREGFRIPRRKGSGWDAGAGGDAGAELQARRMRAVTRVGCKALIRVKRQESGAWVVSRLETEHNHGMEPQSQADCLRSMRLLSEIGKSSGRGRPSRCAKQPPPPPPPSSQPPQLTYPGYGDLIDADTDATSITTNGMERVLTYLKNMQDEDHDFFLELQPDASNMFWADSRSRAAYERFGDVLIFDTSYKTDGYQIPLVSFVGLNNHCHPVLFGCALLTDESEASHVWLFNTFLVAMSGRHPAAITSEHSRTVESAIIHVFPRSRNRLCKWHIFQEARERLRHVFSACPSFDEELQMCMNMVGTISEFEAFWSALVTRFDLKDNTWLQSLHSCRNKWVPVYLRNTFFAELFSDDCCESKTSYFDEFINAETSLLNFIEQYEKALDSRYEREVQSDLDTSYSQPNLKMLTSIEKHAAEAYTSRIFLKFQDQLTEASSFIADKIDGDGVYNTYRVEKSDEQSKAYTVLLNASETKATCNCQMFEYSGILCRHILSVFNAANVLVLPSHYILKRWMKSVKDEGPAKIKNNLSGEPNDLLQVNCHDSRQSLSWRYNNLCREALKFAEKGSTSIDSFLVAIRALEEAMMKVDAANKETQNVRQSSFSHCQKQVSKEKDRQELPICNEIRENNEINGGLINSCDLKCELTTQETREDRASEKEVQLPCNFMLVTPNLSHEPCFSGLLTAASPMALNMPNGQGSSESGKGGSVGNGPVLAGLPTGSFTSADSKSGVSSHASQGWNIVGLGQSNTNSGNNINLTTLSSTETQLLAIPVAFVVAKAGKLVPSSSVETGPTNCLVPVVSQDASQSGVMPGAGRPASVHGSHTPMKGQSGSPVTMNAIRAAAIAAGARIAPPSVAASLMRAAKSKKAIHFKREGGLVAKSPPCTGETLAPDYLLNGKVLNPRAKKNNTINYLPSTSEKERMLMGGVKNNDRSSEERMESMDLDLDEDEDMEDADAIGY